jgi:hypothetical protein
MPAYIPLPSTPIPPGAHLLLVLLFSPCRQERVEQHSHSDLHHREAVSSNMSRLQQHCRCSTSAAQPGRQDESSWAASHARVRSLYILLATI